VSPARPSGAQPPPLRDCTHDSWHHRGLRVFCIGIVFTAPFFFGATPYWVYGPLLALVATAGLASWLTARRAASSSLPRPPVPAVRLLVAFALLVAFQLVPLPPFLLRLLSPGSYAHHDHLAFLPPNRWLPISVSPGDTLVGLLFIVFYSAFYAAVVREFRDLRRQRALLLVFVTCGCLLTIIALLQAASSHPLRLYGIMQPRYDWAVFGPYVNRNHFSNLLAMATPVALGLLAESFEGLRRAWARRRPHWLALGDPEGVLVIRNAAFVLLLAVGMLSARSRGAIFGFLCSALVLPLVTRHRRTMVALVLLCVAAGLYFVDAAPLVDAMRTRGIRGSRIDLWLDTIRVVPHFPLFGVGFDAFGAAYPPYQRYERSLYIYEVHNEYLQILLDAGLVGLALTAAILFTLVRGALRHARQHPVYAGVFAAIVAFCCHSLVEFNWQIPANSLAFTALAAIGMTGAAQSAAPIRRHERSRHTGALAAAANKLDHHSEPG
jgi:O-antigen ligase